MPEAGGTPRLPRHLLSSPVMMKRLTIPVIMSLAFAASAGAQATPETEAVRRFAKAYLTYVPGSTYTVRATLTDDGQVTQVIEAPFEFR